MVFDDKIDPELQEALNSMSGLAGCTTPEQLQEMSSEKLQSISLGLVSGPETVSANPDAIIQNITIPCQDQKSGLLLRVYQPAIRTASQYLPVMLWMHGGGMMVGSVYSGELFCEQVALENHCVVVAVGYRKGPQNPFPAGLKTVIPRYLGWRQRV